MRVAAYIHPRRAIDDPTGVGKHILNMLRGIESTPGFNLEVLAARGEIRPGENTQCLARLNLRTLPLKRRPLEALWELANFPSPDRWADRPDWIYSPAEVAIAKGRVRQAVTMHDVNYFETADWLNFPAARLDRLRRLARRIARRADLILTVSEFSKSRIVHFLGVPPERIAVVYNGVEEGYFTPLDAEVAAPDAEQPYLLVVGGLQARKNAPGIFALAAALAAARSNIEIRVAGSNHDPFASQAAAHPNLRLLGYVRDTELKGMLAKSVALLFPSNYEGFGIPAVEAMAVGAPAIVARTSCFEEIAGGAGLYLDPTNLPASVALVERLQTDLPYRRQIIAAGKRRAREFTWARCAQRLTDALSGQTPPPLPTAAANPA
jgi:glycosyltransferase involved in cell wall biosynthesis